MNRDTVIGIYTNGAITLNQPVDWPDGLSVCVQRETIPSNTESDSCVNGSTWEDTPEAVEQWSIWLESLQPIFEGIELEHFELELRTIRAEQESLLPHRADRIAQLAK